MRFWDPDEGRITLDGDEIRDYLLDELRSRTALVAQDTFLFNDTLKANIMIARPEASDDELDAAIGHASLEGVVRSLPEGLDTRMGEPRHPALGRSAPACRHRPRLSQGCADPDPRRGDESSRRRQRDGGAPRARQAHGRPDDARHRPSPVHHPQCRHHRCHGERPHRRTGDTRRTLHRRRALFPPREATRWRPPGPREAPPGPASVPEPSAADPAAHLDLKMGCRAGIQEDFPGSGQVSCTGVRTRRSTDR